MLPGFGVYKLEAKVTFLHFPVFAESIICKILPCTVMIVTNTLLDQIGQHHKFHFTEEELAWEDW